MKPPPAAPRSPNFDPRPPGSKIDMLVIHYTGMESAKAALDRLCDEASKVSAHYLIDEQGLVIPLVNESLRAWHAGEAFWRGDAGVNSRSTGVELVNPGHEFGYRPFPEAQMAALEELARQIIKRHPVEARNVVGHSDVAPKRKFDPGELFPWRSLAQAGIGLWPKEAKPDDVFDFATRLSEYGYDVSDLPLAIMAFQRHFRPWRVDGAEDEETSGLLTALLDGLT